MSIVSPDPKIRRKKSGSQGASDPQLWKQGLYSGVKGGKEMDKEILSGMVGGYFFAPPKIGS